MNIKEIVSNAGTLPYRELCTALIDRFAVKQPVNWESVMPYAVQQSLFGGEILRLISDHPTLANQKEIRPVCPMKGEISQLLFFFVQLKDEKLSRTVIERITRKFVSGVAADRYIIWFFGNKNADALKIVISGKEGKKIRLKTLTLEAGHWFKTYDYILGEVERRFNTGGLFQSFKEPSVLWKAVWEAFDISIVNKKFYAEIKGVFDALTKEELPKCKGVLTNEKERVQFAIRLIGRVIFCWFLKRKDIISDDVLSSKAVQSTPNYYRSLLEPLFFDVFNTPHNERRKELPDSIKDCPFLNGGLFEPQRQDCKDNWSLYITNNWFEGFFNNTLEKYNFTVDENTAASAEIAIDPEMLGRIFENLLAEQNPETGESARKATGSYYTPREIVDFMVEESLIAYLKTIPLQDVVEDFVHTGTLPEALKTHSKELLEKLNTVKVLDPACGSGAFPISMLQKLVALKQQLVSDAGDNKLYDIKLKTIENSIYGVDIQPMATELSRLRCWLSLIVDEDTKDIKPLPNLDFKFVTANSLIDLGYDEFIDKVETGKGKGLFLHPFKDKLNELRNVRQKYFAQSMNQKDKDNLKKEFNTIKDDLFKMSLDLIKQKFIDTEFANKINKWNPFDDSEAAPFFNKEWMFGVENGFDVVIANPPYIRIQTIDKKLVSYFNAQYKSSTKSYDIYVLFDELGFRLLNKGGAFAYIQPNKFMQADYGVGLRGLFIKERAVYKIINFGDSQIFDNATTYTCLLFMRKIENASVSYIEFKAGQAIELIKQLEYESNDPRILKAAISYNDLDETTWNFGSQDEITARSKLGKMGEKLGNISNKTFQGIVTSADPVYVVEELERPQNGLVKVFSKATQKEYILETAILKPLLKGSDIHRYSIKTQKYRVLFPYMLQGGKVGLISQDTFARQYKKAWTYLKENEDKLRGRENGKMDHDKWHAYVYPKNLDQFEQPKILIQVLANQASMTVDLEGKYYFVGGGNAGGYGLTIKEEYGLDLRYILALLNSRLLDKLLQSFSSQFRGGYFSYAKRYIEQLPIKIAHQDTQTKIVKIVNQILNSQDEAERWHLEKEIDEIVYEIYGLSEEDAKVIVGTETDRLSERLKSRFGKKRNK